MKNKTTNLVDQCYEFGWPSVHFSLVQILIGHFRNCSEMDSCCFVVCCVVLWLVISSKHNTNTTLSTDKIRLAVSAVLCVLTSSVTELGGAVLTVSSLLPSPASWWWVESEVVMATLGGA